MGLPWVCQLAVEQDWRWVVLLGYFHGVMQHSPLHGSAGSSLLKPGASRINREVPSGCSENTVEGGWFLTAARLLPPSTPIASSIPGPCFHTSSPAAEDLSTAHHVSLMLGGANRLRRALLRGSKRAVKMEKIIGERERERESCWKHSCMASGFCASPWALGVLGLHRLCPTRGMEKCR